MIFIHRGNIFVNSWCLCICWKDVFKNNLIVIGVKACDFQEHILLHDILSHALSLINNINVNIFGLSWNNLCIGSRYILQKINIVDKWLAHAYMGFLQLLWFPHIVVFQKHVQYVKIKASQWSIDVKASELFFISLSLGSPEMGSNSPVTLVSITCVENGLMCLMKNSDCISWYKVLPFGHFCSMCKHPLNRLVFHSVKVT